VIEPAPEGAVLGFWQDRDPLEALETAAIADELGYPELWIGEMATFDAFALATAIGARTKQIALTVGPLAVGVRDPVALAMGAASVASLSGRAVRLAVGASSPVLVQEWHGRPWRRTARHLRETVEALRPLLEGERADVDGELVHTRGYRLRLPPPEAEVTVAAFGRAAVRVAAEHADRMVINLVTVEGSRRLREELERYAAEAGRTPPRLALWAPACTEPDDAALAQLARGIVPYLAAPGYGEMLTEAGFGALVERARGGAHPRDLLDAVPPSLPASLGLVGDPDTVRRRAEEYRAAGVDELAVVPATGGDRGGRRTLAALRGPSP
jgi:probable F420-dependent oxidoreductase